jgi:hypothetical protein
MIAGNHEYYNSNHYTKWSTTGCDTIEARDSMMEMLVSHFHNVHFLQKGTFDIPNSNIRILGCTLWSDYDLYNIPVIEKYMNDFKYISLSNNDHITPYELLNIHRDHVSWLKMALTEATNDKKEVIVMTHHLPHLGLIDEHYKGHPANSAFVTDMTPIMDRYKCIVNWFAGHSHSCKEILHTRSDNSTVLCTIHCHGYPDEHVKNYSTSKIVIIGSDRVFEDVTM